MKGFGADPASIVCLCAAAALLSACSLQNGAQPPTVVTALERAHAKPKYAVLYSFKGAPDDASTPEAALVDLNGMLYGTTLEGGAEDAGAIFTIAPSGEEQLLYSFKGYGSGSRTRSAPSDLIDVNGTLYGTTQSGGTNAKGSIFTIAASGKVSVLYSFKGCTIDDGDSPSGDLLDVNGKLYGTTRFGGSTCSASFGGCGTVFSIAPSGSENVLYSFKCYPDGAHPGGGPDSSLVNVNGALYGTTAYGGSKTSGPYCHQGLGDSGCGAVFAITASGSEKVVYSFGGTHDGSPDGVHPTAGLIDVNGKLYGETPMGGPEGEDGGTVFAVTTSGKERVLHGFGGGGDGKGPVGGLVSLKGALYGITRYGGDRQHDDQYGTIFSITPAGEETVLETFDNQGSAFPDARLINVNGTLYGTAQRGADNDGTVFSIKP
jgi:uncharacterized repeat protein (TIGR03803 family)